MELQVNKIKKKNQASHWVAVMVKWDDTMPGTCWAWHAYSFWAAQGIIADDGCGWWKPGFLFWVLGVWFGASVSFNLSGFGEFISKIRMVWNYLILIKDIVKGKSLCNRKEWMFLP